jgi:hypothetical protein
MDNLLGGVAGGFMGGRYLHRVWARRIERNGAKNAIECALRDRSSSHSRIMRRWRHGYAELSSGLIMFQPHMPLGFRLRRPGTAPIVIRVESVSVEPRRAAGFESWYFRGSIFEVETGDAIIEWGISDFDDYEWARALVEPKPTDQ